MALVPLLLAAAPAGGPTFGLTPGKSTGDDAVRRLGRPSVGFDAAERFKNPSFGKGWSYLGDRAPKGTREVQLILSPGDVVMEVHIFPLNPVTAKQIQRRFPGTHATRTLPDGRRAWVYGDGLVIVFRPRGDLVDALAFTPKKEETAALP